MNLHWLVQFVRVDTGSDKTQTLSVKDGPEPWTVMLPYASLVVEHLEARVRDGDASLCYARDRARQVRDWIAECGARSRDSTPTEEP
jgi:hypothetical protein